MATKTRLVQCSAKTRAGWRCSRQKLMPVDRSNNTRLWTCPGHRAMKKRR